MTIFFLPEQKTGNATKLRIRHGDGGGQAEKQVGKDYGSSTLAASLQSGGLYRAATDLGC